MDAAVGPREPLDGDRGNRAVRIGLGVALVFIATFAWIVAVVRPFPSGTIAYDGAASVLFFDRIASGTRLETFVNTTPKPLQTVVYGALHAVTGGWLAISLASAAVAALAAVLGGALAWRMTRPVGGAAALAVIAAGAQVLVEVSWSHALPWALATWLLAGLALTSVRPRYVVAGVALGIGALARGETYLLIAAGSVLSVVLVTIRRAPASALWLLVGWVAIPLTAVHDAALTGDPLFSYRVATINAATFDTRSPGAVADMIRATIAGRGEMTLAALVGVVAALRQPRGWIVAAGIAIVVVGTSALVLALSFAHRETLFYYLDPVIVGIGFGAALGVGFAARAVVEWAAHRRAVGDARLVAIGTGVAGLVLGAIALRPGLLSEQTLAGLREQRAIAASAAAAVDQIRPLAARLTIPRTVGDPEVRPDPSWTRILVPRAVQTRMAVDLGLPMTVVGPLVPNAPTTGVIHDGVLVYHDERADPRGGLARKFEGPSPRTVDGVTFTLLGRPTRRSWLWQSERP